MNLIWYSPARKYAGLYSSGWKVDPTAPRSPPRFFKVSLKKWKCFIFKRSWFTSAAVITTDTWDATLRRCSVLRITATHQLNIIAALAEMSCQCTFFIFFLSEIISPYYLKHKNAPIWNLVNLKIKEKTKEKKKQNNFFFNLKWNTMTCHRVNVIHSIVTRFFFTLLWILPMMLIFFTHSWCLFLDEQFILPNGKPRRKVLFHSLGSTSARNGVCVFLKILVRLWKWDPLWNCRKHTRVCAAVCCLSESGFLRSSRSNYVYPLSSSLSYLLVIWTQTEKW